MVNADPGDTIQVDYTVTNDGAQDTQDVRLLTDAPSPIPDSAVLNLVAKDFTSTSWDSTIGDYSLSTVGDPQTLSDELNGYDAVRYDGTDDKSETATDVAGTDPIVIIITAKVRDTSGIYFMVDGDSDRAIAFNTDDSTSSWDTHRGGTTASDDIGSLDTNWHVFALIGQNSDEVNLEIDGSAIGGGVGNSNILDGLTIADRGSGGNEAPLDITELTVLENYASGDKDDEINRQADKYGISIQ